MTYFLALDRGHTEHKSQIRLPSRVRTVGEIDRDSGEGGYRQTYDPSGSPLEDGVRASTREMGQRWSQFN